MELNRGGPVAAISLSSVHAVCSTLVSRAHCFAVCLNVFPPRPTPNASLNAFVLQLHVSEVDKYGGVWVYGIDAETDCGNRAGYQILTIDLSNSQGTVAAILFHRFVMFVSPCHIGAAPSPHLSMFIACFLYHFSVADRLFRSLSLVFPELICLVGKFLSLCTAPASYTHRTCFGNGLRQPCRQFEGTCRWC